nr:MAG TPA: hypothetical protein [Caudoviricetes sp.]
MKRGTIKSLFFIVSVHELYTNNIKFNFLQIALNGYKH